MNAVVGTAPGEGLARLQSLLERRHSCRAFRPDPLPREVIESLLETARRSASWCNAQPWHVLIVSGEPLQALREDLMARARAGAQPAPELDWPREYRNLHQERRRECGWALYRAVGVEKGDREGSTRQALENFRLFGAPHLALVSSETALGTHGVMDCGAWVANFLLAAEAAGVGSIAQAALASWPDVLRKHLPIPEDKQVVCGISFGYEDTGHPANGFRTTRAPLSETAAFIG
ncbi:nitroreductase [Verticiella sediminum]|uniref:Nitroreductase n=1 Tax=Verticiella sediminum TaxID=1247510 RepID=A0A556A867_9BURK|nr:nitroreductase [Verticiella sediminum]TSH89077.1 nitroreductase [Verticiella sediminum]